MEKHKKTINLIKALIIIATGAIILVGASKILTLKSEDGINQLQALYKQPENSIDVFFVGSSKIYCDIATGVLWDNYGIAAFDLGGAEAPSWVSYYHLKEALKTQKPKVVCYEVSVAAMYDMLYQANNWATDNNYGMKWGTNRIEQLRINSEGDDFALRLNPFNIMHGRYKDLTENDFTNVRDSVNYKGFDPRERIWEMNTPNNGGITEEDPCTEKEEEYFHKLIELARSNDIEIVLFASPYDVPEEDQRVLNYISGIASSENVDYYDFNRYYDEIGMDFSRDMADTGHLNYNGNYKFTNYFGSILHDKYGVPDRRGDKKYVSWEWDSALQSYERNDLNIINEEDVMNIVPLVQTGYIVFGVSNGKAYIMDDGEFVKEAGDGFRLSYEKDGDGFVFVDQNEAEFDHFVSLFVNGKQYKEDYGNVMFIYDKVRHEYVRYIMY